MGGKSLKTRSLKWNSSFHSQEDLLGGYGTGLESLDHVTDILRNAGLESLNLIIGIDFAMNNTSTFLNLHKRRSLHQIGDGLNPYEQALSILARTLAPLNEDNLIPCFGFGDASTHDHDVFSFYSDKSACNGYQEVLTRYREIVPHLRLARETSFAPIIEIAMTIVDQSVGKYHVLLIIADGPVTTTVAHGQLSPQEQMTIEAIVKASTLPLSIIVVGVGDAHWDVMREFCDNFPARDFDNFQFVNFTEIMAKNADTSQKEIEFAVAALKKIPLQYKDARELNMLGYKKGNLLERMPLPPPLSDDQIAIMRKKDFEKHACASKTMSEIFKNRSTFQEMNQLAEEAERRAEIERLRELNTSKGHLESVIRLKGLDIEIVQAYSI